jgi:lactoylglutathione lyase
MLIERGIAVDVRRFAWGTVGVIINPEGNRIELKD